MGGTRSALLAGAMVMSIAACTNNVTGRDAWQSVVSNCAETDLFGKTVMYFGPSNLIGPGSIWRKSDQGEYILRKNNDGMPISDFVGPSNMFECSGEYSSGFNFGAKLDFDKGPVDAELSAALERAKSIKAKAVKVGWVPVEELDYEGYVNSLPNGHPIQSDLQKKSRFVMSRAFAVEGFEAEATFDREVGAKLKAELEENPISGETEIKFETDEKLVISTTGSFFIAGELRSFVAGGFQSEGEDSGIVGEPAEIKTTVGVVINSAD